jgi:uncharacterized protein YigA (DUF484 family)
VGARLKKESTYSALAKRSDELMQILEAVAIDDARVSLAAAQCFKLSRKQLAALEEMEVMEREAHLDQLGWSEEEFQIACEARRPKSEASLGILLAHERTGMRIRKADEIQSAPKVAVVIMAAPNQMTPEKLAKVRVIDAEEK